MPISDAFKVAADEQLIYRFLRVNIVYVHKYTLLTTKTALVRYLYRWNLATHLIQHTIKNLLQANHKYRSQLTSQHPYTRIT